MNLAHVEASPLVIPKIIGPIESRFPVIPSGATGESKGLIWNASGAEAGSFWRSLSRSCVAETRTKQMVKSWMSQRIHVSTASKRPGHDPVDYPGIGSRSTC